MKTMNLPKGLTVGLEPRVVRLESEMSQLIQGQIELRKGQHEMEEAVSKLTVSIEKAQAPQKTDWALVLTAVGMVITIGLLTIAPLYSKSDRQETLIRQHVALDAHPVAVKEMEYLNKQADQRNVRSEARMDRIESQMRREVDMLDAKLQKENALALAATDTKTGELDIRLQREVILITERADARLTKVENWIQNRQRDDFEELRQRRVMSDCKEVAP